MDVNTSYLPITVFSFRSMLFTHMMIWIKLNVAFFAVAVPFTRMLHWFGGSKVRAVLISHSQVILGYGG